MFAFITSWDELVVTMFITSRRNLHLRRVIWDGIPATSARHRGVATVLIITDAAIHHPRALLYLRRRA